MLSVEATKRSALFCLGTGGSGSVWVFRRPGFCFVWDWECAVAPACMVLRLGAFIHEIKCAVCGMLFGTSPLGDSIFVLLPPS